jgi:hypothetical protein
MWPACRHGFAASGWPILLDFCGVMGRLQVSQDKAAPPIQNLIFPIAIGGPFGRPAAGSYAVARACPKSRFKRQNRTATWALFAQSNGVRSDGKKTLASEPAEALRSAENLLAKDGMTPH